MLLINVTISVGTPWAISRGLGFRLTRSRRTTDTRFECLHMRAHWEIFDTGNSVNGWSVRSTCSHNGVTRQNVNTAKRTTTNSRLSEINEKTHTWKKSLPTKDSTKQQTHGERSDRGDSHNTIDDQSTTATRHKGERDGDWRAQDPTKYETFEQRNEYSMYLRVPCSITAQGFFRPSTTRNGQQACKITE